jgi:hypothetical protein
MFHLRQHSSDTVYGVLIDISSGTVGVAIVSSKLGEKLPQLIYTYRNTMRITKYGGEKSENIRRVREALFSASLTLSQEGIGVLSNHDAHATITKLYITCSAPWSFTIARTVDLKNDDSIKVTGTIIDDLIQSAETEILNYLHTLPEVSEEEFSIVERTTVDYRVNDYPTTHPIGHTGTELSLTHIAGLVPQDVIGVVEEVREKLFPHIELHTHTYMLVMYCVVRDMFPHTHTMCIVDITGEATEFAVIEEGLLVENTFIPVGSNTFIRDIMSATGKPSADIQSFISGTETGSTTDTSYETYKDAYEQEVCTALQHIQERHAIPKKLIVTVQQSYQHFFEPMVMNAFEKTIHTRPHMLAIRKSNTDTVMHGTGDDIYLAICARFFHKIHALGEVDLP